jgi:hypothetical protein
MRQHRREIAALLEKSQRDLTRSQEIHAQLQTLMRNVDDLLSRRVPVTGKPNT